jgi:hypothetical protein
MSSEQREILYCSLLIAHCSFLFALTAQPGIFASNVEAAIAYPFIAALAAVELHVRFQIGLFKGGAVFLGPEQPPGFLMLNGQAACLKRHGWASPFLAADVAEKAERKAYFVRMVYGLPG